MSDVFSLNGKTAIVTGASSGIGAGAAISLARQGADIIMCARRVPEMEAVAEKIRALGRRVLCVKLDQRDYSAVKKFIREDVKNFGGADILVANAGVSARQQIVETTAEEMDRIIDTNYKGTVYILQETAKLMISQKRAGQNIIIVSSVNAFRPLRSQAVYTGTKSALEALMRCLAADLSEAAPKIRVNSLAPGATLTELGGKKTPEEYEKAKNANKPNIPLGRIGLIEDMGDPIAFLASDAARYITGATLLVDGGLSLRMDL